MSNFLLEIGTEELPADFAVLVLSQLKQVVENDLSVQRISFGEILCTSTPRRIVLLINNLSEKAEDYSEERKGPPCSQAFKEGEPTDAAIGFARRFGIGLDQLEVRDTSKGKFVFAKIFEKGLPSAEILALLIPQWIEALQGQRFMRWGDGQKRFSRPIRWLLALLNDELISVILKDTDPEVSSSNISFCHRLYKEKVEITSIDNYFQLLKQFGVHVERSSRLKLIKELVLKSSKEMNLIADLSNELLDELTDIVESPNLIKGKIDESFLDLPAEVLSTVMRVHQRYIPLYLNNLKIDPLSLKARDYLSPDFLCICNGLTSARETVKKGNERVLRARLADARFFVESDLSISSQERTDNLSKVTFSEGLGSLLDRVKRIEWITCLIIDFLGMEELRANASRAAHFCKHDLVSQIVGEFPELQGLMGGKYLLAENESREVALAVIEQYLPKGSGDDLPSSNLGAILALAERFELLFSIFAKGERPSGSSDPYALRRAGNGILQILWSKAWSLNLRTLLEDSFDHWSNLFPSFDLKSTRYISELNDFFHLRIISLLEEEGIDIDIIQSAAGKDINTSKLLKDVNDVRVRVDLLVEMRATNKLKTVQSVVARASKLAGKGDLPLEVLSPKGVVRDELFEKSSEGDVLRILRDIEPIVTNQLTAKSYSELARLLISGSDVLESFFDGKDSVMVMSDDLELRSNRLNLLCILRNQSMILADFSKINN